MGEHATCDGGKVANAMRMRPVSRRSMVSLMHKWFLKREIVASKELAQAVP
jgi:hypothetical protein